MKAGLADLLSRQDCVILDGALATELEARGCNLNDPLWSAKILLERPSVIRDVHEAYFRAGADVAITASYQASYEGFARKGLNQEESSALIIQTVQLAREAQHKVQQDEPAREMLVAGSVGPYGAYLADGSEYRGDYNVSAEQLRDFHSPRIEALLDARADLLAFETIPSFTEMTALLELLESCPQETEAWFSFTLRDSAHLSDGTDLVEVVARLNGSSRVVAIGLNCVPPALVSPALGHLRQLTKKPLLTYPNSGEEWDASSNTWSGTSEEDMTSGQQVREWHEKGARLIGGCCRTGPGTIVQIRKLLQTRDRA